MELSEFNSASDPNWSEAADPQAERERFMITDDAAASWALRKLAALRKRQAELDAVAASELRRVEEWHLSESGKLTVDATYFTAILTEYARAQRETGRKSITLPTGVIKSRTSSARVDVQDVDQFLAWATPNAPSLIRVRREPDKAAMKAALTVDGGKVIDPTTGEIVPGVTAVQPETTYTITTEEPSA